MALRAICKIGHEGCCQDANKAKGETECFIGIEAPHQVLALRIPRAKPCFNCFKGFTHKHFEKHHPL